MPCRSPRRTQPDDRTRIIGRRAWVGTRSPILTVAALSEINDTLQPHLQLKWGIRALFSGHLRLNRRHPPAVELARLDSWERFAGLDNDFQLAQPRQIDRSGVKIAIKPIGIRLAAEISGTKPFARRHRAPAFGRGADCPRQSIRPKTRGPPPKTARGLPANAPGSIQPGSTVVSMRSAAYCLCRMIRWADAQGVPWAGRQNTLQRIGTWPHPCQPFRVFSEPTSQPMGSDYYFPSSCRPRRPH